MKKRHNDLSRSASLLAPEEAVWGFHPVGAMLRHRPEEVLTVFITPGRADGRREEIRNLAADCGVRVERVAAMPLSEGEELLHQGVMARIKPITHLSLEDLLLRLHSGPQSSKGPPLLLALDSIQDPRNLGAIIRSAAAFGVNGLIIPKDRSAPLTGTVMKAAVGTLPLVDICQVTNLAEALARLKKHDFWIYGAGGEAPQSLYATNFDGSVCLVLGNEQKGLRPLVRRQCDQLIAIPLAAGVESLNVAVAAGVILSEIRKRDRA